MASSPPTFADLLAATTWQPIPNCPGRYRLRPRGVTPPLAALVGAAAPIREYRVPAARDVVLVVRLVDGGVISYRRSDGSCLHTLNDTDGFARKLAQLGIVDDGLAA